MLDHVASLVDMSLLRMEEAADGEPRFTMLETIREYAEEQLAAARPSTVPAGRSTLISEEELVRRRHAGFFVELVEAWHDRMWVGSPQLLVRLDAERDNLRAALAWGRTADDGEAAVRLAGALGPYWTRMGYYTEGQHWLEDALSRPAARTRAVPRARVLSWIGRVLCEQRMPEQGQPLLEESVAIWRETGERRGLALTLVTLGYQLTALGDYAGAQACHEEAIALAREMGDDDYLAMALSYLGLNAMAAGGWEVARTHIAESLDLGRQTGNLSRVAVALRYMGYIDLRRGDATRAAALYAESLAFNQRTREDRAVAACIAALAGVAAAGARYEQAARLLGAATASREAAGATLFLEFDQQEHDRTLAAARAAAGDAIFTAAFEAGRALTLEQAIAEALAMAAGIG